MSRPGEVYVGPLTPQEQEWVHRHRVLLRPPSQIGIIVARAELDQPCTALKVATLILERIG
jgi:hypothetical protein